MLWPIIILSTGLTIILAFIFAYMNIEKIKADWANQRCNPLIMISAYLYKPAGDNRTPGAFSQDNFDFCTRKMVDEVMTFMAIPLKQAIKLQLEATGSLSGAINIMRLALKNLWDSFIKILDPFFKTFISAGVQFRRIFERLLAVYKRIGAILTASLYAGLSLMNGYLSIYEFIKKVIIIIMAILVALFIILFLVMAPFVAALIIPVFGIMAAAGIDMPGRDVFCIASGSLVMLNSGINAPIQKIKLGDKLAYNCGTVTGILEVTGSNESLYSIDGIHISGAHIIWQSSDNSWQCVKNCQKSQKTTASYDKLYVLNTTSSKIPLLSPKNTLLIAKDWEELDPRDELADKLWNDAVYNILNQSSEPLHAGLKAQPVGQNSLNFGVDCQTPECSNLKAPRALIPHSELNKVPEDPVLPPVSGPLLGNSIRVKTSSDFVTIDVLAIGDYIWDSLNNNYTQIEGIYKGFIRSGFFSISDGNWIYKDGSWQHPQKAEGLIPDIYGWQIITTSGTFTIYKRDSEYVVRDFTETGSDKIHETYEMVSERINLPSYK